jgi:hypothetical protein
MNPAERHSRWLYWVAGPLLLGAVTVALGIGFLRAFAPGRPAERAPLYRGYDPAAMDAALAPDQVRTGMDALLSLGPRFQGLEGFAKARRQLRDAYAAAGLQTLEYTHKTLAPRTLRRELCDATGAPLEGVEIFPFMPNHFQPIVTPEAGLTGTLLPVTDEVLRSRDTFTDCIALVDAEDPPRLYGFNWVPYAQAGFKAVIVAHRQGLDAVRWETVGAMRASSPVNYTRLAASEGIFRHTNETVTVRVKVTWEAVEDSTLVGILPAPQPAAEAVVVSAPVDACSVLPDRSPGLLGAMNMAAQLAALKGVQAYRDDPRRKRDLVFVSSSSQSMGLLAVDELTSIVGSATKRDAARDRTCALRAENQAQFDRVKACRSLFDDPGFMDDVAVTVARVEALVPDVRKTFDEELRYTINTILVELSEGQLQARLAFLRVGGKDTSTPQFAAYLKARGAYDDGMATAGLPLRKMLREELPRAVVQNCNLRGRLAGRLDELVAHHAWKARQLDQATALHEALRRYNRLVAFGAFLAPSDPAKTKGEAFSFFMGPNVESRVLLQSPVVNDLIQSVLQAGGGEAGLRYEALRRRDHNNWAASLIRGIPVEASLWNAKGYPGFVLINTDREYAYGRFGAPTAAGDCDLTTVRHSLKMFGRTLLALTYGAGAFESPLPPALTTYSGRVYLSNVGRSIVPNHPLASALIGHKGPSGSYEQAGYNVYPFLFTDPYGCYSLPTAALNLRNDNTPGYSPETVAFGPDGLIRYAKDEGAQGQRVFKSINVGRWGNRENINIVAFRASPVTLFDVINPQNLKAYTGFGFVTRDGLAAVAKYGVYGMANGFVTAYLEPDARFFVTLSSGSADNPRVQSVRAFLLGVDESFKGEDSREIDGRGYLAADTAFLIDVPREAAHSMLWVNGRRLDLQQRYHMADARACTFHLRSEELLERGGVRDQPKHAAEQDQRAAVTYATLNHPVIRRGIYEAVVGILWYLGLLVPFVFFFEKLAFGFSDIRKQLAAQTVIFLVVFLLLRWLHPAFAMIRSSLMILLGFVIMLISGGITLLFSGKFRENLEELRKRRGQVTAAEVNRMGVLGTAFALGLNNMHRRIVRTGLTCATLVLLTFAMICFTSVQSDVVDSVTAVGKAAYQGMLIKPERFEPISEAEFFALRNRYEHKYTVTPRRMVVGMQGWDRINYNPVIEAVHEPTNDIARRKQALSILELAPEEPLRDRIRLLTHTGWFTKEMVKTEIDVPPVLIPEPMAAALNIRPSDVEAGGVKIKLSGKQVRVHGIYDPASLAGLRDLDGRDLLPFDIEAMRTVQILGNSVLAEDNDPRLGADGIVIAPKAIGVTGANGVNRLVSVAVCMPELTYKGAKKEIDQYLEQSGQATYYGLGGITYRGKRAREKSFAGLLELLIPLVIAAMTVLNTMRGSVYERRDEIFVYNAVGIAPRYIFVMFISEAFVYSVVGSVLGYLLSQGLGKALTALGWTGGLNMTFASLNTIYASLAIMVAVFISTLFPARSAMQMAAPAEDAGWKLPTPEDDRMTFALPFTFGPRDRIAVLAFFHRFFADHGEGSAGRFFADVPALGIDRMPAGAAPTTGYLPELATTIWLKPFDLGVSQELRIAMPTDPETGEFIARITLTRLSGTRESWVRLNEPFVALLRRHFLYWRAVSPAERKTMFDEARGLLEAAVKRSEAVHG